MNVSFEKTKYLIHIVDMAVMWLSEVPYHEATKLKDHTSENLSELYSELIQIELSASSEDVKQQNRFEAFARAFNRPGDLNAGSEFLDVTFSEIAVNEKLTELSNILLGSKLLKDVESEFWSNCNNPGEINYFLDLYLVKFEGKLKEADLSYFSFHSLLFDSENKHHQHIQELRRCGLLKSEEGRLEMKISSVAKGVNIMCSRITDMFQGIRRSTQPSNIKKTVYKEAESPLIRYSAKHYVLMYIFECNAFGRGLPAGNKKELERIGSELIGAGKGNRFYKLFCEAVSIDLNKEKNLLVFGGENWREAILNLTNHPKEIEEYLIIREL